MLVLGLSGENVARLMAKEPILISPEQMRALGLPDMAVLILGGRTEEAMVSDLEIHGFLAAGRSGAPE